MRAKIDFGNGKIVELSEESTVRLKKELGVKTVYERCISSGYIRISSTSAIPGSTNFPVRFTLPGDFRQGLPMNEYGGACSEVGGLSGYTMAITEAKELVKLLEECIEFEETRNGKSAS